VTQGRGQTHLVLRFLQQGCHLHPKLLVLLGHACMRTHTACQQMGCSTVPCYVALMILDWRVPGRSHPPSCEWRGLAGQRIRCHRH